MGRSWYEVLQDESETITKLISSEAKFRALFESTGDAILLFHENKVFDCNQAALEMFEVESKDVFYTSPPSLLSPETQPDGVNSQIEADEKIAIAMQQGSNRFEWVHKRLKSGEEFFSEVLLNKIDFEGRPMLQAIVRDISQHKKVEEALLESTQSWKAMINSSPDGIGIVGLDGKLVFTSEKLLKMYGFELEEQSLLIGKSIFDFIDLTHHLRIKQRLEEVISGKEKDSMTEYLCIKKDKSLFTVEVNSTALKDSSGKIANILIVQRDITQRKRLEAQLQISEMNYRTFFESMDDLIFISDRQGKIFYANGAVNRKLGYSIEEISQMEVLEVYPIEMRMAARKLFSDVIHGKAEFCQLPFQRKDGVLIPSQTHVWYGQWNEKDCVFGISKDLSIEQAALDKFHKIFDNNPALMAVSDLKEGKFIEVNSTFLEKLGYERDEVIGKTSFELDVFINEMEQLKVVDNLEKNGLFKNAELSVKKKNGQIIDGIFSGEILDNQFEKTLLTVMIDITERKNAEEQLRISEEKYMAIFDESPIAIELYNAQCFRTHLNNACKELFGISSLEDMSCCKLFDDPYLTEELKLKLLENKHVRFETVLDFDVVKSNHIFNSRHSGIKYLDVSIKSMLNDKILDGYIVQIMDITTQKKAQAEIEFLSYHDRITGIYNRRFYEEELLRLDIKRNLPLTLVMADVNGLKLVNDSFGHDLGDELLRKTAKIIKGVCRADDIVARLGGDEFVILLPKTDTFEAEEIIKRIKMISLNEKVGVVDISISFGCETKHSEETLIQEVFKNAEDNMYRNKLYESASLKSKMIGLIMNTLYEKSYREMAHSKGVSGMCERIALKMAFDQDTINRIKVAGLMHDIGKMGIDEKILNKAGTLSIEEWHEIKRHPEIGYRMLSTSNEFSEMANVVLEHQERWDGQGYPKGLKGEEISLQARIIAIADAYDAMTSNSSYRKQFDKEEAITEIRSGAGTQFDPHIANVFIEMIATSI
jgi:diguanylate cyclase (GGDEF)-like protein/PAS domain S-box-containing protein